jgi:hypothetical protein
VEAWRGGQNILITGRTFCGALTGGSLCASEPDSNAHGRPGCRVGIPRFLYVLCRSLCHHLACTSPGM